MNSPAWRKDPLIGLGGPMTRNRAKKMKEALHGLVRVIQRDTKLRVEEEAKKITLLKVENSDGVSDSQPCAAAQNSWTKLRRSASKGIWGDEFFCAAAQKPLHRSAPTNFWECIFLRRSARNCVNLCAAAHLKTSERMHFLHRGGTMPAPQRNAQTLFLWIFVFQLFLELFITILTLRILCLFLGFVTYKTYEIVSRQTDKTILKSVFEKRE